MTAPYGTRKDWVSVGTRISPALLKRMRKAQRALKSNQRDFVALGIQRLCELCELGREVYKAGAEARK